MAGCRRWLIAAVVLHAAAACAVAEEKVAKNDAGGGGTKPSVATVAALRPFLTAHCVRCHGEDDAEADLRLDRLDDRTFSADGEVWLRIFERTATGDMPPADEPQPNAADRAAAVGRMHELLARSGQAGALQFPDKGNRIPHELLFGPLPANAPPVASPARLWRISPYQYRALISEVGGERYKPQRGFATKAGALPVPIEFRGGPGLQDYSALYRIDEGQTEQLVLNARDLASRMFSQTHEELKERQRTSGQESINKYHAPRELGAMSKQQEPLADEQVDLFLDVVSQAVLRRKPSDDERRRYGDFLRRETKTYGNRTGMENALAAYLLHPATMFRLELPDGPTDEHGRTMLGPLQLAYAVSSALTDVPPDRRLIEAVGKGRLQSRDDVRREVERTLAEVLTPNEGQTRMSRVLRFFQEYFGYTSAPQVFKDESLLLPEVREHLVNDTDRLIFDVLRADRQVLRELLTTPRSYVMIDALRSVLYREAKAKGFSHPFGPKNHVNEVYDLATEDWRETQPLEFAAERRAGILTQPSWLIAHSTNDSNDAIHRGKWVRERLLGGSVPDTPITVDAQLPDEPDKPLRERMRVTREAFCWKCHQRMDPLGLPFEMFDHWGRHRTEELGRPVDARGEIVQSADPKLNGPVRDAVDLVHRLAKSEHVEQVFVRHAFRFWMGRNETTADAPVLQAAWRAYHDNDGSMQALIVSLLTSDAFLYRRIEEK